MNLPIDIYLDSGDLKEIIRAVHNPVVKGFTTNPTLMCRSGVTDYEHFARTVLEVAAWRPVSFEVVSEEPHEVMRQAVKIQSWGRNVNVKVPLVKSNGEHNLDLIGELMCHGVQVNITAMISLAHVSQVLSALPSGPAILSVFAGRLADTGQPPFTTMKAAVEKAALHPGKRLLWASVREPFNIYEAAKAGCHIVTVPPEMLAKAVQWCNRSPDIISAETSKQFITDALSAGLTL